MWGRTGPGRGAEAWGRGRPTSYAAGRPGREATCQEPGVLCICEKTSASVDTVYQHPRRRQEEGCTDARGLGARTVPPAATAGGVLTAGPLKGHTDGTGVARMFPESA